MDKYRVSKQDLMHYVRTALYTFRDHEKAMRDITTDHPMMTRQAAQRMAEEFHTYAIRSERMLTILESSEFVELLHDPDCTEASCEFPTHTHEDSDED